jgi:hypothetical protein
MWPSPLDAVVTLRARDISLREALDRLGAGSGVPLAYSSDLLPLDRSVCVDADRQPLGLVMVGGLLVSQVLTLFTTPVVYLFFDRLARRARGAHTQAPFPVDAAVENPAP